MAHLHRDEDFDLRGALQEIKRLSERLVLMTTEKQKWETNWDLQRKLHRKDTDLLEIELDVMKQRLDKLKQVVIMLETIDFHLDEHREVNKVIEFIKKI